MKKVLSHHHDAMLLCTGPGSYRESSETMSWNKYSSLQLSQASVRVMGNCSQALLNIIPPNKAFTWAWDLGSSKWGPQVKTYCWIQSWPVQMSNWEHQYWILCEWEISFDYTKLLKSGGIVVNIQHPTGQYFPFVDEAMKFKVEITVSWSQTVLGLGFGLCSS